MLLIGVILLAAFYLTLCWQRRRMARHYEERPGWWLGPKRARIAWSYFLCSTPFWIRAVAWLWLSIAISLILLGLP